jgi:TRAP-type mannitol/chloroaromatic compound transport system permease small subunit
MLDAILWFFTNLVLGFWYLIQALINPSLWLDWSNPEAIMRFVYYGASAELFFVVLDILIVVIVCALIWRRFAWGVVRALEGFANSVGRVAAWAGLLMVIQQIVIIWMQRIFTSSEISLGFGGAFTRDISWWSEELKLYNAIIVALCVSYTFVQKGHVRVDLVYSAIGYRAKRVIDMIGSIVFMMPVAILIWLYGWFFLWRHLIVPNPSASDPLDRLLMKSRALRWNVETIGFSPNGFDAYFLFKILLVLFALLVGLQAIAFLFRSYLELVEGPESEDRYLDRDVLDEAEEAVQASGHEGEAL